MKGIYTVQDCVSLLRQKQEQLRSDGLSRYPQRSDFTEDEMVAIKAHLGPWPRALEAAGLKPERDADGAKAEQMKQRRIHQKLLRRQAKQNKG